MKTLAAVSIALAALPCFAAEVTACRRDGNRFALEFTDGTGEIEWISLSSFRFARDWAGVAPRRSPISDGAVDVVFAESPDAYEFRTRYVTVRLDKATARLSEADHAGKPLFSDVAVTRSVDGVRVEKALASDERICGLGIRQTPKLDLHGMRLRAGKTLLISSAGYGEYYRVPANYAFDIGVEQADVRSAMLLGAHRLEYFVYYGPQPKEILGEHATIGGTIEPLEPAQFAVQDSRRLPLSASVVPAELEASWGALREYVYSLQHASMSGVLLPDFDLTPYLKAAPPLRARAEQLAGVLPLVHALAPGDVSSRVAEFRKRMGHIFLSYAHEARERGTPFIHPMAMQFPNDAAAAERSDQFMVGDELMAAPVLGPEARRSVYLPMGMWTDLRTNERYTGRQSIEIEAGDEVPLFAKSGSIVPLARADGVTELHYYPNSGAEFFLYERGAEGFSQMHAGPAGVYLRLEIESAAARRYEWIVHHASPFRSVQAGGHDLKWSLDEGNLHIKVDVEPGDDLIVNIAN